MGGCCSTDAASDRSNEEEKEFSDSGPSSSGYADGPLTLDDINARITAPNTSQDLTVGNYSISFGYVSQRGYYPESLSKPNQDSFACIPKFGGDENQALFSVFDGHGAFGDLCARFVTDTVHIQLLYTRKLL